MSAVQTILMLAIIFPLLLAISWVREELRMGEPRTRFGFGIAALIGAVAIFIALRKLLPEPQMIEGDLFLQTIPIGGVSALAGGIALSVALIGSAAWQSYKRWKFHRSNGS